MLISSATSYLESLFYAVPLSVLPLLNSVARMDLMKGALLYGILRRLHGKWNSCRIQQFWLHAPFMQEIQHI